METLVSDRTQTSDLTLASTQVSDRIPHSDLTLVSVLDLEAIQTLEEIQDSVVMDHLLTVSVEISSRILLNRPNRRMSRTGFPANIK